MNAFAEASASNLAERVPALGRRVFDRRRELNRMRGGMWVFDGVPWDRGRHLADAEWDIAWRLAFGGLTDEQQSIRQEAPPPSPDQHARHEERGAHRQCGGERVTTPDNHGATSERRHRHERNGKWGACR